MRIVTFPERTRVPPVTPHRLPPASRTTGADSPVMADSSTRATPSDDLTVTGNDLAICHQYLIALAKRQSRDLLCASVGKQAAGFGIASGLAKRLRLGSAPALGQCFGKVGKQYGKPEPDADLHIEGISSPAQNIAGGDQMSSGQLPSPRQTSPDFSTACADRAWEWNLWRPAASDPTARGWTY